MHDGDCISDDMLETFLRYLLMFVYDLFYDISSAEGIVPNARVVIEFERM
jgi:hypothetical protein